MVDETIYAEIVAYIPGGERSDFVNDSLGVALKAFRRKKAAENMDKLREEFKFSMSTDQFLKLRNAGRP